LTLPASPESRATPPRKVEFYRHPLDRADAARVADVLASPFLTSGRVAAAVERQLCDYFDVPYALLSNSWTNGALAVLLALGVGPDDEVIVPAMTFVASANIVELVGATTVFVDVDPATLLMTPQAAAAAVTPRTRAVIPVHLYGRMVDIAALRTALDARAAPGQHIAIVEDCAHCFEGRLGSDRPGRHSDAAVFSFYATKNVTCGEGGAMIFSSRSLFEASRETRLHGMSALAIERFAGGGYNHWDMARLGVKANLPDLLAALLPSQIASIDERLALREALAGTYTGAFAGTGIRLPQAVETCTSAWHLFAIGVTGARRDEAIGALNEAGISVTVNFRAPPALTYYRHKYPGAAGRCPEAVRWGDETLSLPFHPGLTGEDQTYVIDTVLARVVPLCART
jgi:UDP-4-amino-4-deoxy-L-arabinose-oxoglutarate aminotransferase